MTNADRIKNMTYFELAKFLYEISGSSNDEIYIDGKWMNSFKLIEWLQEESKEDNVEFNETYGEFLNTNNTMVCPKCGFKNNKETFNNKCKQCGYKYG